MSSSFLYILEVHTLGSRLLNHSVVVVVVAV